MKKSFLVIGILSTMISITSCKTKEKEVMEFPDESEIESTVLEKKDKEDKEIEEVEKPKEIEDEHIGQSRDVITGSWINEDVASRRPIAVMINNHNKALPQSGIGQAGIIYEVPVEGGINRLMAVFHDFNSDKIGPVRSARHYFLDLASDHDAIYVHYGKSPQALKAFDVLNAPHLEGLSYLDNIMCWRDNTRFAPHNVYTNYDKLFKAWETVGYRKEVKEDFTSKFSFSEDQIECDNVEEFINNIRVKYSYYQTSTFEYNKKTYMYKRFQFGKPHIDANTNEQLEFKNIIIQYTNVYNIPNDSAGRLDMNLVSSGKGLYITNGNVQDITWKKNSYSEPTLLYDSKNEQLKINKGKTWYMIVPNEIKVELNYKGE